MENQLYIHRSTQNLKNIFSIRNIHLEFWLFGMSRDVRCDLSPDICLIKIFYGLKIDLLG